MKNIKYCPNCGCDKFTQHKIKAWHCQSCQFIYFHNTAAAVVAVLRYQDEILLTVRKNNPCKGMFDLPGGFVDYHETLEAALTREIKEELHLDIHVNEWDYFGSYANRYEYEGITYHTADAFFIKGFDKKPDIVADDDVADATWIGIQDIDLTEIGLVSIRHAIRHMQRMQLALGVSSYCKINKKESFT